MKIAQIKLNNSKHDFFRAKWYHIEIRQSPRLSKMHLQAEFCTLNEKCPRGVNLS